MKPALAVLACTLALAGALWVAWPQEPPGSVPASAGDVPSAPAAPVAGRPWLDDWPPERKTATAADAPVPAAHSLAQTRLHGDPEAPPIAQDASTPMPPRPTAQELADPRAYQDYEARQNAQVLAAYVKAVDQELPRLREDIERGRAMGISADQIAKAEAKARGLEAMRAQLLKDRPASGR